MRPRHETMDETMDEAIDRVAANLTAVPDDSSFVTRLESRLAARAPRARGLWLVAASATAAVILAVIVNVDREAPSSRVPGPTQFASAPEAPAAVPTVVEAARPLERQVARVALQPVQTPMDSIPQIAALNEPQTLNVEDLRFDPLSVEPVNEPGLLELPGLEVRGLDVADQKEQ